MTRLLLLAIFVCSLGLVVLGDNVLASGRKISDIPNPNKDPLACGRIDVAKSAVCDPDNILSKDTKDEIEGFIKLVKNAQLAIALIDKMDIGSSNIDAAAEKYARTLHDTWGVGSAKRNDGVLVFLSIKDRAIYISSGIDVKYMLSKALNGIIKDMKPSLKKFEYGMAILVSIIEIDMYLNGRGGIDKALIQHILKESYHGNDDFNWFPFKVILGVILVLAAIGKWIEYKRYNTIRGYERGKAALESLMKDVDNTEENNKFFTTSCPICLEDFPVTAAATSSNSSNIKCDVSSTKEMADDEDDDDSDDVNTAPIAKDNKIGSELVKSDTPNICTTTSGEPTVSAATQSGAKRPKVLRCGHTFCAECLESFLKTSEGNKCPICRMPVEEGGSNGYQPHSHHHNHTDYDEDSNSDDDTGSGGGRSGSGGNGEQSRRSCADSFNTEDLPTHTEEAVGLHQRHTSSASSSTQQSSGVFSRRTPELLFRMNRMRYLYPDYMTVEMLRSMNTAIERGNIHEFRSHITSRGSEVVRIVSDIRERAAQQVSYQSSSGSSTSFGGGRSGGGGGGRW